MNTKKATKRALLTSVMALVMCVVMLVGTTFAWFTDTASTAVNKIQAGNLDVALEMSTDGTNWESAEGKTLTFKTQDNRAADQILWEPGCTYELPQLRVVNKGNLALKYKVIINGIKGDAKLNNAIEWTMTLDGSEYVIGSEHHLIAKSGDTVDADVLTIKGHMKEEAGNEYQGLSIDAIAITVVATQDTVEYDSNNNTYDTNATYLNTDAQANNYFISNADELVYFAKSVNVDGETYAGKTVKLTADIDLAGKLWIPVGQTQVSSFQGTFDGQDHTIKNMTVNYTGTNSNYACGLFGWIELHNGAPIVIQNVKFYNANVTGIKYTGVVAGYANGASGAEIKNCVVTNSTVTSNSKNAGGIIGYMGKGVLTGNTVSGCTISAKYDVGGIANSVEPAVTFTKNKVENTKIYYEEDQSYDAAGIFTGGKVVYRDDNTKTTFVPDSTNTSSNATVTKLVTVSNATELRELAEDSTVTNASITLPKTTAEAPLTTNISVPGGKNLTINGATSNPADTVINGQIATTASNEGTLVIRNCTINVDDNIFDSTGISQTGSSAIAIWGDQKVICENVVFNMSKVDSTAITSWWDTGVGTNIIARNCTFNCNGQRPIRATCNVTVENCTFNDPYRYAVQLTSKSNTAVGIENAVINFNNNTINNGASGKAFVYGVQLEGEDYGCQNLIINGSGNTINAGEWDTGNESTMYYCECGFVQHNTITWNTEVVPVHKGH